MGRPAKTPKTLHIRNGKLWPSTLYVGSTIIKFLCGSKGRRIKVEHNGRGKPRHNRLQSKPGKSIMPPDSDLPRS